MLKNFRTYHLAVEFYRQTRSLKLPVELRTQLARAASSVALNLAEGAGRETKADQRRFFTIAFGSLRECQAIIELTGTPGSEIVECVDKLAAHLFRLVRGTGG